MSGAAQIAGNPARNVALGCLYITLAGALFSIMLSVVRLAAAELHPFEIAFFRFFFGALFMVPYILRHSSGGADNVWRSNRMRTHGLRSVFTVLATLSWFSALAALPIAQAVSLNFTAPLFVTIGAALVLGEVVRFRRWAATVVGFIGVLVILRPGVAAVEPAMALPILAAAFMAVSILFIKSLSRTESVATIITYQNLVPLPAFFIIALFVWTTPSWQVLGLVALIGLLGNLAHFFLTRAFALADASVVMPFDYLRLPFAAAVAFFVFNEVPDPWTWLGAAIIAASAIYIGRREAKLAAEGRRPPPPPPALEPKLPA